MTAAGSGLVLRQPVVEPVDDGIERGLIEVAAYSRCHPGLMPVGVEANRDAHVRGRIVRCDVESRHGECAQTQVCW